MTPAINAITRPLAVLWVVVAATLASGCVTTPELACGQHEADSKALKTATQYRPVPEASRAQAARLDARNLPRGSVAQAPTYRLALEPAFIRPCTNLSVQKELWLTRAAQVDGTLRETREFYAEDGTLIAAVNEDLTAQLRNSGVYRATVPLPIPRAAPPGRYRIVSRLNLERRGGGSVALGRAEARFCIVPLDLP